MPYLLLGIGFLLGLYGLYKFFMNAEIRQIKALFAVGSFVVVCVAVFFLAVTGRLPAALAAVVALSPFVAGYLKHHKNRTDNPSKPSADKAMTREEAFEVLGLEDGATEKDIKDAYKKLMKKVHPDQEGSEWLAAKLNEAKDILLK